MTKCNSGGGQSQIYKPRPGRMGFDRAVYQSPAFCALCKNGKLIVIAAMDARKFDRVGRGKDKQYILTNGDDIRLPYVKLTEVYHMNMPGISRGINDALAKGFLTLEHHGGGGRHDQSTFALSENYLYWKRGTVFQTRPKVIRRGFQDPAYQATRRAVKENLRIMKR